MANTATTTTVISHAATANFRVWVAEIITQLLAVGLTQTADTGQINTTTVAKPAINTIAGYATFRFNDTLQATSPVFFKLEFGTGSSAANPLLLITFGTGSSGAGAITGVVGTRRAACLDATPASTVTTYVSRFAYNPTFGVFSLVWKIGSPGSAVQQSMGGIIIARSNDNTGAATSDSVWLITNSASITGANQIGYQECISHLTGIVYPVVSGVSAPATNWGFIPYYDQNLSNLVGSNTQLGPVAYMTPSYEISAAAGIGLIADIPLGTTFSTVLVGTVARTYLQVGYPFGQGPVQASPSTGLCVLWQ